MSIHVTSARAALGMVLLAALGALPRGGAAEGPLGPASGTLRIETTSIAAGIGVSWGDGVLVLDGREHRFSLQGLTVLDVGVSRVSAQGEVYGLTDIAQFEGNYYGVDAGMAVGGGSAGLAMRNQHGVYIKLRATQQGVKLSLASQGTTIALREAEPAP